MRKAKKYYEYILNKLKLNISLNLIATKIILNKKYKYTIYNKSQLR